MKKVLSIILVTVMLLAVAVVPAHAAGETDGAFRVGETVYTTFSDAWAAATSSTEGTIYVVKDYTINEATDRKKTLDTSKTVNIIGVKDETKTGREQYPTLTKAVSNDFVISSLKGSLSFTDINIVASKLFETTGSANINFNNVDAKIPDDGTNDGVFIKMWGSAGEPNVTIDKCTMTSLSSVRPCIIRLGYSNAKTATVNIKDSTLISKGEITNADSGVFTVYSDSCTMNVDLENSKIYNETTGTTKSCIWTNAAKGTVNVTADSTSIIGSTGAASADNPIIDGNGTETLSLSNGAKLITGKEADLPVSADTEGSTDLGFVCGDKIYKEDATAPAGEYTFLSYTDADFSMIEGASIRKVDPVGIRFGLNVSESFLNKVNKFAAFGMLALPETLRGENELTVSTEKVANQPIADTTKALYDEEKGTYTYFLALVGMKATKEAVTTEYASRGYFTVTYADESSETFYTSFSADNNVRSMYETAVNVMAKGEEGAILDQIVALAEGGTN